MEMIVVPGGAAALESDRRAANAEPMGEMRLDEYFAEAAARPVRGQPAQSVSRAISAL